MIEKQLVADENEKEDAGKTLGNLLFDCNNNDDVGLWLHDHLDERLPGVEKILAADSGSSSTEILDESLPRTLVDMFGSELFEGQYGAKLRKKILCNLFERGDYAKIRKIFFKSSPPGADYKDLALEYKENKKSAAKKCLEKLTDSKKRRWTPGGSFARVFVEQIDLADIFAGIRSDPSPQRVEEAIPKADLEGLRNFQANMKSQLVDILQGSEENRAIVALPTGAGKTRIVVEAIVEFLNSRSVERNILWIAQSQEVCEQAVLCFKQIWEQYGKGETLRIFRAWGNNDLPTSDEHGIIVGGIQKLVSQKDKLHHMSDDGLLSGVFIDEAHHSVADSYKQVLEGIEMSGFPDGIRDNDKIPLIGLTATPERRIQGETKALLNIYGNKRIYPNGKHIPSFESRGIVFDEKWKKLNFMRKKLEELKYLAHAEFIPIDPGIKHIKLNQEETEDLDEGGDLWIKKIATEPERHNNIKNEIIKEAKQGRKILYFGTNVAQSNAMSRILEKEGFSSVCITGDTRYAVRKLYVDTFNEKNDAKIQIMCNYSVLSTGFDSPKIDSVIIARPTTSIVEYQQMVGRGLRGEEFGGKLGNHCRIITVSDNILRFDGDKVPLVYEQFKKDGGYAD